MTTDCYSLQSFLGPEFEEFMACCTLGVSGLGGGGSHIVQQLALMGFQNYVLYDEDAPEESNLNGIIGATTADALAGTSKLHLAKTLIYGLQPHANVRGFPCSWRDDPQPMRDCHIVFGCVDDYKEREELEIACRRYLTHYIDVGMDLHIAESPAIHGQVILSSPGGLCMRCMGFLNDEKLAREAQPGNSGARSRVVWPSAVLASTAVGVAVDLVTNWTRKQRSHAYLVYDGNEGTIKESATLRQLDIVACTHFGESDVGDPALVEENC